MGNKQFGIDNNRLMQYANDIKEISDLNVEIGIVIGGGNILEEFKQKKVVWIELREIIWEC